MMRGVVELWVKRRVTGVMVFLILALLGGFTFARLKLDMLPNIEFPIVAVISQYPGADPESIEQLVTRPIEGAMASVENVEDVNSTSTQGASIVLIKFAWGTDMQIAENDVRKNLEVYALDALPDDVPRPLTFAFDPSMQPIAFLTINAPGSPEQVRKLTEDLVEPYVARIPGVAAAELMGGAKREIQVRVRPEWLQAYRIPVQQVVMALRSANLMMPGGTIDQGAQELTISTKAQFTSVRQIREVVVGQANGVPVHVRDVADVLDTFEEESSVVRSNGRSAVMMAVRKQSDANTVQVVGRVLGELSRIEAQLPAGSEVRRVFDQALPIQRALSNLSSSAYLAILLTAAVLLAFLRSWRTSTIVLVSIPLSLLATFAVMDWQGVTLNIISMAGLALAVGMLVDNSIVVLENIFTHVSRGEPIRQAAVEGTVEMAMPIVASTLTTIVVFAPILFVPGLAGQMFRDMSLTICFSLLASLAVALTMVPLMATFLVRARRLNWFEGAVARLTWWIDPLAERYGAFLGKVMRHRKKTLWITAAVFAGCMALATSLGFDFMPKNDQAQLIFQVKAAPGTSLDTSNELFREVEKIIHANVPEAEVVVATFGGGGTPFAAILGENSYSGTVRVRLPARKDRVRSQTQIEDALRAHFAGLAGVEVKPFNGMGGLLGGGGDVTVKVFSDDLDKARRYGQRLKSKLETVEGAKDVTFSMQEGVPELAVKLDREQIKQLGLQPGEVAATISTYFLGTRATMYREGGDEYRVLVRAPRDVREDISKLRALPVVTPRGVVVPLDAVAKIDQALGATAVSRENQRRLATLNVAADRVSLGMLVTRVNDAIAQIGPADDVSTEVGGTAEDLKESFQALGLAFLVAILLVYMVMASQFESLLEPFVILFAIPLSVAGVVLGLAITRTTVQVTALIGLILLVGVVVNNGIVLVDVLKRKRERGEDLVEAAIHAGRSRLRPILMTTFTTIFGMIPLAFEIGDGSEMWAPMARAVIGGMTLSTLLTLVVVPVIYVALANLADRKKRALRQVEPAAQTAPAPEPKSAVAS